MAAIKAKGSLTLEVADLLLCGHWLTRRTLREHSFPVRAHHGTRRHNLFMDDGLVLNLAADNDWIPKKAVETKKGGKWTDR